VGDGLAGGVDAEDAARLPRRIGVVAIRHGYEVGERVNELYSVGCLAVLDRVVQVTDGLFLVLSHGTRRFRLLAGSEVNILPDGSLDYADITRVPEGEDVEPALRDLLGRPAVARVHVRADTSQCFTYEVVPGGGHS